MIDGVIDGMGQSLLLQVAFGATYILYCPPCSLSYCASWVEVQTSFVGPVLTEGGVFSVLNPVVTGWMGCYTFCGLALVPLFHPSGEMACLYGSSHRCADSL